MDEARLRALIHIEYVDSVHVSIVEMDVARLRALTHCSFANIIKLILCRNGCSMLKGINTRKFVPRRIRKGRTRNGISA